MSEQRGFPPYQQHSFYPRSPQTPSHINHCCCLDQITSLLTMDVVIVEVVLLSLALEAAFEVGMCRYWQPLMLSATALKFYAIYCVVIFGVFCPFWSFGHQFLLSVPPPQLPSGVRAPSTLY